ncbi:MAG TPA: cupin domain-containing protein [Allosphingosinicella sp.]|nr:cupin domain-containing protein [Allosphingosinicella sp.]
MPKLDLDAIESTNRTGYPPPYDAPMSKRHYRRLAPAAAIGDFGISHVVLEPGGISSQRHWHEGEDEVVIMLAGEAVLIEDDGETVMRPGDVAAFPKGVPNGHHLLNRTDAPCVFIAVGKPADTDCHYPDIDLHLVGARGEYVRKDGSGFG